MIDKYDIAKMIEMRNSGLTCEEVAAKFYISPQVVSSYTKEYCVRPNKNIAFKLDKKDIEKKKKQEKKKINDEFKRQQAKKNKEQLAYNQNSLELEKQFYTEWMPEVFK